MALRIPSHSLALGFCRCILAEIHRSTMESLLALQQYEDDDDSKQTAQTQPPQSHQSDSLLPPPKRARKERSAASATPAAPARSRLPTPDFAAASASTMASARAPGLRLRSDHYTTSAPSAAASAAAAASSPAVSLPAPAVAASSAAHGGRVRSFPHVDGAWAAHIYLPLSFPPCEVCRQGSPRTHCLRSQDAFERLAAQAEQEATREMESLDASDAAPADAREQPHDASAALTGEKSKRAHDASPGVSWTKYTVSIPLGPAEEGMVTRSAASSASFSAAAAAASAVSSSSSAASAASASSLVHVSLSRTFVLRYDQISDFVGAVRAALSEVLAETPPLQLAFRESKLYWNEERTRAFAALRVSPTNGESNVETTLPASKSARPAPPCAAEAWSAAASAHATLLDLIARVDAALAEFGLQGYYQPPEPHATVAWTLPTQQPRRREAPAAATSAALDPTTAVPLPPTEACVTVCDRVHLSIGNRTYTFPFRP